MTRTQCAIYVGFLWTMTALALGPVIGYYLGRRSDEQFEDRSCD